MAATPENQYTYIISLGDDNPYFTIAYGVNPEDAVRGYYYDMDGYCSVEHDDDYREEFLVDTYCLQPTISEDLVDSLTDMDSEQLEDWITQRRGDSIAQVAIVRVILEKAGMHFGQV